MRRPLLPRMAAAVTAMAAALSATIFAGCAATPREAVPSVLVPAAGDHEVATIGARGVQIYECRRGTDNAGPAWAFVAPEAELFDQSGRRIGTHGAGPYWQSTDGSRIVGKLLASSAAPAPDAIAWLLLGTHSTGPAGVFSRVTHVQRLNTQGGTAPKSPCNPQRLGESARIAYAADYRLFTTL
jgi:hypothetical protein